MIASPLRSDSGMHTSLWEEGVFRIMLYNDVFVSLRILKDGALNIGDSSR